MNQAHHRAHNTDRRSVSSTGLPELGGVGHVLGSRVDLKLQRGLDVVDLHAVGHHPERLLEEGVFDRAQLTLDGEHALSTRLGGHVHDLSNHRPVIGLLVQVDLPDVLHGLDDDRHGVVREHAGECAADHNQRGRRHQDVREVAALSEVTANDGDHGEYGPDYRS